MLHRISLISIVLVFILQHNTAFAQRKTGKVIIPKIEYIKDDFKRGSDKKSNNPNYGTGPLILKNDYKDLFEDYEGKAVIDDKPQYTSRSNYVLEKIVYTKTEIIFSLSIHFKAGDHTSAIFYPRNHRYHWFLKDLSTGKKRSFKAVRMIRKDGDLKSKQLADFPLSIPANEKTSTVFTCRVHFERLPDSSKSVYLIEGKGKTNDKNHFNFFNIKLK